ncbi:MAG: HAD family hydrolase [Steroidobacteraceae bacterium]
MSGARPSNVIFDFGGVLVRWRPQEIIDSFYSDPELRDALRRGVFEHADWIELDRGSLSEEGAVRRFAQRLGRPEEEMHALMRGVKEHLTPVEETFALVRALAARNLAVYGLSNMAASVFAHLRQRDPHWDVFRGIVISAEVRLIKPDRAIFDCICGRYHLDPAQTVFIDDHPANVESARKLGLRTILFRSPGQCADELEALLG